MAPYLLGRLTSHMDRGGPGLGEASRLPEWSGQPRAICHVSEGISTPRNQGHQPQGSENLWRIWGNFCCGGVACCIWDASLVATFGNMFPKSCRVLQQDLRLIQVRHARIHGQSVRYRRQDAFAALPAH
ncbi:hypothetical protein FOIG_06600 [Fusarium odoratissimum NRRL 54006]|uniref:Uncharacterized protein n=2 Tax=Fusarium oxysporum species complex TaxID=171631 RepID=X0K0Z1_FUSO5|nr:uncharacterized protein FOIG_06600 [Fusarium odoratissimum NRRL 54006]EXM02347.1 hypothetical protein FOIG_06600 [Fusarium odoratissimum NRRL 54006]TXC08208.1 hypothetical protein FocTR4_00003883 [Fusarium oxysporum f. sp. cubense]